MLSVGGDIMKVKMLKAEYGDCFIVSTVNKSNENLNILVDGGLRTTYRAGLKLEIEKILKNNERIDYIIITHIDEDHVMGILSLLEDEEFFDKLGVKEVFYNYNMGFAASIRKDGNISAKQGERIARKLLEKKGLKINNNVLNGHSFDFDGLKITFLSPRKKQLKELYTWMSNKLPGFKANTNISSLEDDYDIDIDKFDQNILLDSGTVTNNSSLAFLVEAEDKRILMMGDANPNTVAEELGKIKLESDQFLILDLVKLSHHGGENSVSSKLLETIKCERYLISTNGKRFKHPRKKTLVDIIRRQENAALYFNYKRSVFKEHECQKYNFKYFEESTEIEL